MMMEKGQDSLLYDAALVLLRHLPLWTPDTPTLDSLLLHALSRRGPAGRPAPPEELGSSFAAMQADPIVYSTMLGPSEFTIVGTLKDWSCLDQIHTIDCPTLLTNGADDEAQDVAVQPFFAKIPKVRWVTFANSSHMAFFEERDRYFEIVGKFLTGA
ncbi:hypothetical protein L210DRAFT_3634476 [Boletus edulis BED1]|uniref:Proline iminopeptidase n=1 Tax=Boletus edulis BED1 TaxID=1328754 RepID=A0AAD4G8C4_BOLED|nr:hypothetical protein L210DRAFT_3634476 [Boletus edulis BED1]